MVAVKASTIYGRCRVCKKEKALRKSHLLPRALYKLLRDPLGSNPNPVFVTSRLNLPTSQQLTAYLLCDDCEQRLNKNGETWVLRHCYREVGQFLLRDKLRLATPVWSKPGTSYFAARSIRSIDINKLVYFAASVLWRASIHTWRFSGQTVRIYLGKRYEEEFRQYLLGTADLPANAVVLASVSTSKEPFKAIPVPYGEKEGSYFHYRLVVPGIFFHLYLGGRIPSQFRRGCTYRSQENLICLTDRVDQRLLADAVNSFGG